MMILKLSSPLLVGPWRASVYSRLTCLWKFQQWLKQNPAPVFCDRNHLWQNIISDLDLERNPIKFLEFGVWKGESLAWWTKALRNPHSEFIGFDCFTGLPEDWDASYPKGHFDVGGQVPDIPDKRVSYRVGLFKDTLEPFLREHHLKDQLTVLHLDADLYSSTLYCLTCLRKLSSSKFDS